MIEFKLPELGEDIKEGSVINVFVSPGDVVTKEQSLIELETDKAALEIPSPSDGKIKEVLVSNGDRVEIGQVIVKIDDGDSSEEPKSKTSNNEVEPEVKEETTETKPETKSKSEKKKEDIKDEKEKESESEKAEVVVEEKEEKDNKQAEQSKEDDPIIPVPAPPSVRRLAREIGVNINSVSGSGPGGRITEEDVKEFAKSIFNETAPNVASSSASLVNLPDFSKWGEIIVEEMSTVRKLTAKQLESAWIAPHVTQCDRADITELEQIRKQNKERVKKAGGNLTMTAIIIKVVASALKKFPKFNCSIDIKNEKIIYKNFINIGVAVDTERGLLVPVIRDVDKKNIIDISVELGDLSERARNKKIKPDELQGNTFTVTNVGGIGGTYFTPIINHPDVAILGITRSAFEPIYDGKEFKPRLMMPVCLSYDHRIIDGAEAARFTRWFCEAIKQPFNIMLEG